MHTLVSDSATLREQLAVITQTENLTEAELMAAHGLRVTSLMMEVGSQLCWALAGSNQNVLTQRSLISRQGWRFMGLVSGGLGHLHTAGCNGLLKSYSS